MPCEAAFSAVTYELVYGFCKVHVLLTRAETSCCVRIPLAALVLEFIRMCSKLRKVSALELYSCLSRCLQLGQT